MKVEARMLRFFAKPSDILALPRLPAGLRTGYIAEVLKVSEDRELQTVDCPVPEL